MATKDITKQSDTDLIKELAEARSRLQELRFESASGKVSGINEYKTTRKKVARLLTERRRRELAT